jgi:hypothetical protein
MSASLGVARASVPASARVAMSVFAVTLFLSAFLLFSIQPFFTKLTLPRLGGSPAVWSVAMVFFQGVLLLGYAYAHLLARFRNVRIGAAIHLIVLAAAFLVLPIAIPAGWEAWWLLAMLATAVGMPFFAVSANGALLQAWFSKSAHPQAQDPYFLYGASNVGSFVSLLLYIVLIEPAMTLPQQSLAWTIGYGILIVFIACCAFMIATGSKTSETRQQGRDSSPVIAQGRIAAWIGLGFVPSGLLVAVTSHITTDVAAAPFLWVAPLALFLLTFVLVFRTRPLVSVAWLRRLLPVLAAPTLLTLLLETGLPVWLPILLHLGFFLAAALYCHAILYGLRPAADRLTNFYLCMSLGGVLGGAFASLLAPVAFSWIAEYPILIVITLLVGRGSWLQLREAAYAAVAATIVSLFAMLILQSEALFASLSLAVVAVIAALFVTQLRWQAATLPLAAAALPLIFLQQTISPSLFRERSFFGVIRVQPSENGQYVQMAHGTTLHGAEKVREPDGRAVEGKPVPLTYYHPKGGMAASIDLVQRNTSGSGRFGIVGLGAGSVACYAQPDEEWSFFEIDRSVVTAARDAGLFRFLSACGPSMPIVLGDARLTLSEQKAGFDYLLIDAFSSDSIPTHLMTREAVALFQSKVGKDGLLAFHISNRYLELESVLAAVAGSLNLPIRVGLFEADPALPRSQASIVAVMTKNPALLGQIDNDRRWKVPNAGGVSPWTDDYSNIISALLRRQAQ